MKDRIFWKVIAVGVVLGLFAVAYGLCMNSHVPSLSLSSPAYAADAAPEKATLHFEFLSTLDAVGLTSRAKVQGIISRAKVEGGWLLYVVPSGSESHSLAFYPDPKHAWDGGSMK
jgi:hypothetical protein